MNPTLIAIIGAAHMANWGISILLAQLCASRTLDLWSQRDLPSNSLPLTLVSPHAIIAIGFLLAISQIVGFSMREYQQFLGWRDYQQEIGTLTALWLVGATRVVLVYILAYHRRRKMIWCAGWVVTSHIIILGALWTRIP